MKTFKVNSPVKVGDKKYKSGTLDADPKTVKALVRSGSLSPVGSDDAGLGPQYLTAPVTLEQFSEGVSKLDPGAEGHFTGAGLPDVKALAAVGVSLKAKERDALWAELKKSTEGT